MRITRVSLLLLCEGRLGGCDLLQNTSMRVVQEDLSIYFFLGFRDVYRCRTLHDKVEDPASIAVVEYEIFSLHVLVFKEWNRRGKVVEAVLLPS